MTVFSGMLGGKDSQLAFLQFAYDEGDYFLVDWIRNVRPDVGFVEQDFGTDEGGHPIQLYLGVPKTLTRQQLAQAVANGAVVLHAARYDVGGHRIIIYDPVSISDSGFATIRRANVEPWSISDSATRSSRTITGRSASERWVSNDFAVPSGAHFKQSNDVVAALSDNARVIAYNVHIAQLSEYRSQPGGLFQLGIG